jgi:hypothetical protein
MCITEIEKIFLEEWSNDELFEMANLHSKRHGIKDVVIWVGMTNNQHGLRVKVSNIKNKFSIDDHFIIQMPSLDYNPKNVAKWIDTEPILEWIKLNQKLLYDYENGLISDTDIFLNKVVPI